jgi:hypothetical protein
VSKVSINGAGHAIEVQHDGGDLAYVIGKAQKLWEDTRQPEQGGAASYGFASEREQRKDGFTWRLGEGGQPAVKP